MPITNVSRTQLGKSLILSLDDGVDNQGKSKFVSKTFSNVNTKASDADVLNSAVILASLQSRDLAEVIVQERNVLLG